MRQVAPRNSRLVLWSGPRTPAWHLKMRGESKGSREKFPERLSTEMWAYFSFCPAFPQSGRFICAVGRCPVPSPCPIPTWLLEIL